MFLPFNQNGSIWRHSRGFARTDPKQGWKLHIAATVLNANDVLAAVGPFLFERKVLFKGPRSLYELSKMNTGIQYGYTQLGKCFTIYPRTTTEAVSLAESLDQLTKGIDAPAIPFDQRLRPGSSVYYRYGAFIRQEMQLEDRTVFAIQNPRGELVQDKRSSLQVPEWAADPFPRQTRKRSNTDNPLKTTFRVLRALSQRGKGGVYQAIDFSASSPRLCILKEGRKGGELAWDGSDGYSRVKKEQEILIRLRALGICVPLVYASFEVDGHFYLVTEFLQGITLQNLLNRRKRRLSVKCVLKFSEEVARLLQALHSVGWSWRDCKPANLLVTHEGIIRPFDFEGAGPIEDVNQTPWGTPAFIPPEFGQLENSRDGRASDLYALGVLMYYLLTGQYPTRPAVVRAGKLRRHLSLELEELVLQLLNIIPQRRPSAAQVVAHLNRANHNLNHT